MTEHLEKTRIGFKKMFVTGILILVPIGVTAWILRFLIVRTQSLSRPLVEKIVNWTGASTSVPDLLITIVSLCLVLLAIMISGWLTSFYLGKKLLSLVDMLMMKVPFVRSIYGGTKQIIDAFSVERSGSFKKVVLLEYPKKGCWVIGFVTNEKLAESMELFGNRLVGVFVPSTPNPTTGFLLYLDPFDLLLIDLEVDEAVKLIVSAGLVLPKASHKMPITLGEQLGLSKDHAPTEIS